MSRAAPCILLLTLLTLAAPIAQRGHATASAPVLLSADPASGAIESHPPHAVKLTFSEPIDPSRSLVLVLSDAMAIVNTAATIQGSRHDELVTPLNSGLRPGPYAVIWTATSSSGVAVRQSYLFTIGPPTAPIIPNHAVALSKRSGDLTVTLNVPTDRVDHQSFVIGLTAAGRPVSNAQVTMVGRALDMEMGDTPAITHPLGGGRYRAIGDVVMAGTWQVTITVRRGSRTTTVVFSYQAHY